jgi:uncharacterized protein with von Willebrand factor type A (vWA) domain
VSSIEKSLASKTVEFCATLRGEHGFNIGVHEALEAVRAIEAVGVSERARVAAALRAVCCSRSEEIATFDTAFRAFFSTLGAGDAQRRHPERRARRVDDDAAAGANAERVRRTPESESLGEAWQAMLARYSPAAALAEAPAIPTDGLDAMRREADRIIARLHLGRTLRWKPQTRGARFDLRRTLRASLRTGGDLFEPRALGHPLRNPRFILLLDGSRSMGEHAPRMLQFAYALCTRSRRAHVYLFSTQLREVTRALREAGRNGSFRLEALGESWGGGTRIGASLRDFVRRNHARLTGQTFVVVVSDGLDVGEIPELRRAMQGIARRCAAVAWVNPHAGDPSYVPSARGMQAALPYLRAFTSLDRMDRLTNLRRRLRVFVDA